MQAVTGAVRLLRTPALFSCRYLSSRPSLLRPGQGKALASTKFRPQAITIFPGDYSDDSDPWNDDDDDDGGFGEKDSIAAIEDRETDLLVKDLEVHEEMEQATRERWLRNAKPPVRVPVVDARGRSYGRGGRKRAQARVWIQAGLGEIVVNRKPFVDYFTRQTDREHVLLPLVATETIGSFDVQIMVKGGGLTGQAGAARLGVARALNAYNPDVYRPALKHLDLLTRDARKVERKTVGHVKARKSPQWVRR